MILINNICGPYDAETSEGRGANAAFNVIKYIEEGKKIAETKAKLLLKGEISIEEASRNSALEKLSQSYIPYTEIDEETKEINLEYALTFASVYINAFDLDNKGYISPEVAAPCGHIIDQVDPNGQITPAKFLAWLVFQDCTESFNGVISPNEAGKSVMFATSEPQYVVEKLKKIYEKLELKEKGEGFKPEHINIK